MEGCWQSRIRLLGAIEPFWSLVLTWLKLVTQVFFIKTRDGWGPYGHVPKFGPVYLALIRVSSSCLWLTSTEMRPTGLTQTGHLCRSGAAEPARPPFSPPSMSVGAQHSYSSGEASVFCIVLSISLSQISLAPKHCGLWGYGEAVL